MRSLPRRARIRRAQATRFSIRSSGTIAERSQTTIYWTQPVYDALSRVTQTGLYFGANTFVATLGKTIYTNGEKIITVEDAAGRAREYTVDHLGRLEKVREENPGTGSFDSTWVTSCVYDKLDNLTQVSQGGQLRTYRYDALSRLLYERTPEQDATISDGAGGLWSARYEYYTDKDLLWKRTDARGVVTTYGYDNLHRPQSASYATAGTTALVTPSVTITYNNHSSARSDNGQGASVALAGTAGTESFTYDSFGRVQNRTWTTDGQPARQTTYGYNSLGGVNALTYPSDRQVVYKPDLRGRLSTVSRIGYTYASGLLYSPAGQLTNLSLGNGVDEAYTYDAARLQLQKQTAIKTSESRTLLDLTYGYSATQPDQLGAGTGTGKNAGQLLSIAGNVQGRAQQHTPTIASAPQGGKPVIGNWDGVNTSENHDTVGVYDPVESKFHLINTVRVPISGTTVTVFQYGAPGAGWIPIHPDPWRLGQRQRRHGWSLRPGERRVLSEE